ncbi:hypothetical protein [Persicirhabdus sediminis]|uniref:Uncharacterized protein n=1 Tax=Persicirhabdus sediminis TaxID=454144 RepID=A0A8J7MD63_9BACT|nr:hypothetical protein [Persicirhabdus sediminis]MBK1790387.1 hypothetical protein [Persicirhabdus sediminis]
MQSVKSVPVEIYCRVLKVASHITEAIINDDKVMHQVHVQRLRSLYDEYIITNGGAHPFLIETIADFTEDLPEAVMWYQLAIKESAKYPDEPVYTKQISAGERLIFCSNRSMHEQAAAFLTDGHRGALEEEDWEWIGRSGDLLEQMP